MEIGIVMLVMGVGSSTAAVMHYRNARRGEPVYYPLSYDLLGALGFLAFGAGTLFRIELFTGTGRLWLLALIPVAIDKWRRTLVVRAHVRARRKQECMQDGKPWKG
jgi:hypothetical protein